MPPKETNHSERSDCDREGSFINSPQNFPIPNFVIRTEHYRVGITETKVLFSSHMLLIKERIHIFRRLVVSQRCSAAVKCVYIVITPISIGR